MQYAQSCIPIHMPSNLQCHSNDIYITYITNQVYLVLIYWISWRSQYGTYEILFSYHYSMSGFWAQNFDNFYVRFLSSKFWPFLCQVFELKILTIFMSGFWAQNFDIFFTINEDIGETRLIWFLYIEFHEDHNMVPKRLYSHIMSGFWAQNFDFGAQTQFIYFWAKKKLTSIFWAPQK